MIRRRGLRAFMGTVALSIVVAACSTGTSSSSGGGTHGVVHFDIVEPFTGDQAATGVATFAGASAAAEAINEAGGILGQTLVLDQVDTLADPADAVPAMNREIAVNNPIGSIGPSGQDAPAVVPILERYKVPTELNAGDPAWDNLTNPYVWRANASDSQLGVAMALYAWQKGYKKAVLMFSSIESAQGLKAPIKAAYQKLGGTILGDVSLAPLQSAYRSEVQTVVNLHPDAIFTQMEPTTAAAVLHNFRELGPLTIPLVGSDITAGSNVISAITPTVAHQILTSIEGAPTSGKARDTFVHFYSKFQPGADTSGPLADSQYAYDATIVLALAIDAAGTTTDSLKIANAIPTVSNPPGTTVNSYLDGLAALKNGKINYDGASGPMDYNQFHNVFGDFQAVQSDTSGALQQVALLKAGDLKAATP